MQKQSRSVLGGGPCQCVDTSLVEILRAQLCLSRGLSFVMRAHNGLSGAIAERAE